MKRRGFVFGALALGACSSARPKLRAIEAALLPSFRIGADAPAEAWAAHLDLGRMRSGPKVLALSGGGEDGAFGAGVLTGWSEAGGRPEFDVVTGVSTGALMAPFAFLGPEFDPELRRIYTSYNGEDLLEVQGLPGILGASLASSFPMKGLIRKHLPDPVIDRIGAEYRKGRRLFVVTSNLDTGRAVIWDMGAIADAGRHELFRAVTLASASIPGLFPPVRLDFGAGREAHVDGGVHMPLLAVPEAAFSNPSGGMRGGALYILVNNTLRPSPEPVRRQSFSIMQQTFATMVRSQAAQSVGIARRYAERTGMRFAVATIGPDFDVEWNATERFSQDYMQPLFEYGRARVLAGRAWKNG
ncbi:patatin-like phospholipase family protein [Roseovarius aquimarinus]|uniref:Patatin-like phospholipase family protein n=1 Tax=Roseovarius aquimarinus TaxID=1229156 RepID=A0ABW7I801_9RHOB